MAHTGSSAKTSRSVFAVGTNVFGQICADVKACISPASGFDSAAPFHIADAAEIVACCTTQTIYRSHSGQLEALGESIEALTKLLHVVNRSEGQTKSLVWIGQDEFIAATSPHVTYFLDSVNASFDQTTQGWKHAVSDSRGRIVSIDVALQNLYLFDTVEQFRQASLPSSVEQRAKHQLVSTHDKELPRFSSLSAGAAHFIALAESSMAPVWVLGDTRYGAVPLEPRPNTQFAATAQHDPACRLLPVPLCSSADSFSSADVKAVCAGARHSLVLTHQGHVHAWGWNEDACILPSSRDTIVPEPQLIDLGNEDEIIIDMSASNSRSFLATQQGRLLVAGSNEFGCCGLSRTQESSLRLKTKKERAFSQIKRTYDCLDGFQSHPWFQHDSESYGNVVAVHASTFATFVTVERNT